jgi:hypothetical protein
MARSGARSALPGAILEVSVEIAIGARLGLDVRRDGVYRMGEATGMHDDEPEVVATAIVRAIVARRREVFLGRPEGFFARLNTVWPGVMDVALRRRTRVMRPFAIENGCGRR